MNLIDRVFSVVYGISPGDIGLFPTSSEELVPVSLWCDDISFTNIVKIYRSVGENNADKVNHLNKIAKRHSLHSWNELLPYIVGPFWGIITKSINLDEAELVPRIGSSFVYSPDLGMVVIKGLGLVFFRISPSQHSGIFPPFNQINKGIDIHSIKKILRKNGWRIDQIPGSKIDK